MNHQRRRPPEESENSRHHICECFWQCWVLAGTCLKFAIRCAQTQISDDGVKFAGGSCCWLII